MGHQRISAPPAQDCNQTGSLPMRTANIIVSLVLLGFAGFYAYLIVNLPARDLPNTLGAAFMPWLLSGLLAILALILLTTSILKKNDGSSVSLPAKDLIGIAGLMVLIIIFVNAMKLLGFVVSSIFFLGILTWIAGSRKPVEIATFSIATTIAVYLLFHKFFNVQLPAGIFD